jgi:hypothetical protein
MTAIRNYRIDSFVAGLGVKAPCKAVAISNITLSGEQTVNGVACVVGDRVLVTAQTSSVNNGIYNVETSAWARSGDFDGNRDVVRGTLVTVNASVGQDLFYQVTSANPITIGTSAITFLLTNDPNVTYTTAQLADITHAVNTSTNKVAGAMVWNSTTGRPVWAFGSADGSVWVDAAGATLHTPV